MGKQPAITPGIAFRQFFRSHVPGPKDHVTGVIEPPVPVKKTVLRFHLLEQRRARIRRQDMKSRAFQSVLLDPGRCLLEHGLAVMIES